MLLWSYSVGAVPLASMRIKTKKVDRNRKPLLAWDVDKVTPRGEISNPKQDN